MRFEPLGDVPASALLNEKAILTRALPHRQFCGVYFLILDGKVIYIGQSMDVKKRIRQHFEKRFDSFACIPCAMEDLERLEGAYMNLLKPPQNL